ncbi:MAG: enoyl-CoA hydratase/isomerase family protein [Chromatiales bacterium]|nr:enoyl-CoA hydratase/isomerase family protein [Chromatiales bacterium]
MTDDTPLLAHRTGRVLTLTLNRPRRLNALDADLRGRIRAALEAAAGDDEVGAVLLVGSGERAFCAGQDLNESATLDGADDGGWIESWRAFFAAFFDFPKPLLAALNGVTAGGGLEIAMFCDVRLAAPHARLIMSEIDVGLPTLIGSHWLDAHLGLSRMTEIVLTGRAVSAAEARDVGLVHEVVDADRLPARALEHAAELAAKPPHAMTLNVRRFRDISARRRHESRLFDALVAFQREAVASGEPRAAMEAFLRERAARRSRAE